MTNHHNYHDKTTTTTTTTSTTGGSTTSSTGARARSIEGNVLHGWYVDVCEYYADTFRREPGPGIRRDIAEAIKAGMTGECFMAIIDESQNAPRPSWAYCMAILRRCQGMGIKTMDDWRTDRMRHEGSKNPALNYAQRQYKDEDFGPDFFVKLEDWATPEEIEEFHKKYGYN